MVRLEISRRLAAQPPPADAALLQDFADLLDTEFALAAEHGPGAYRSLHYDPDRLYYIGFQQARLYWRLTSTQRAAYCQGLFFDALRRHPDLYVRKVVAQMALYFRQPYAPANIRLGAIDRSLVLSEDLIAHPRPYVPAALLGRYQPVIERARLILSGSWVSPLRIAFSLRMVEAYALLNPLFAWLLGGPILLTVVSALWPTWRAAIPWRRMAPVLGLAIWATGSAVACALTSSVLQALEIQRYIDLFLPLTLFSELLWPLIGLSVALSFPKERSKAAAAS
jgi:uncharacterized RDD family membrane protein YckC